MEKFCSKQNCCSRGFGTPAVQRSWQFLRTVSLTACCIPQPPPRPPATPQPQPANIDWTHAPLTAQLTTAPAHPCLPPRLLPSLLPGRPFTPAPCPLPLSHPPTFFPLPPAVPGAQQQRGPRAAAAGQAAHPVGAAGHSAGAGGHGGRGRGRGRRAAATDRLGDGGVNPARLPAA